MSVYEKHLFDKELPVIFHLDRLNKQKNESCLSNWHENIELIYCVDGKGWAVINSNPIEINRGSVLAINSGDIHYFMSSMEGMNYYCLIIDSGFLKEFGIDVENISFCEEITDDQGEHFFQRLIWEMEQQQPYYKTVVRGEMIAYMAYLCRNYTVEKRNRENNSQIKCGLTYIKEHFTESLSVELIASQAGFSRFYFSRQFKLVMGMSVMKYVEFLRCRYARGLLENGATVSEAAAESGFSDLSYFAKVFKRQYGMVPSKVKGK